MDDETVYQDVNETIRQQFESGWLAGEPQPIEVVIGDVNAPNYLQKNLPKLRKKQQQD